MKTQKQEWFKTIENEDQKLSLKLPIDIKGYEDEAGCECWSSILESNGIDYHVFTSDYSAGVQAIMNDLLNFYNMVQRVPYNDLVPSVKLWRDFFDKHIDRYEQPVVIEVKIDVMSFTLEEAKALWDECSKLFISILHTKDRRTKEYKIWHEIINKFYAILKEEDQ